MPRPTQPNLIPGRQSLNIGWEVVLPTDRNAHAKQGFHEHGVGTGRTGAIHIADLQGEIVVLRTLGLNTHET